MKKGIIYLSAIFILASITVLIARGFRVEKMPNGIVHDCANCHFDAGGGGPRTPFGEAVNNLVSPGGNEDFWDANFAALDSDGDGYTNGQELQDPNGTWQTGQAEPGDPALVSNPGDANSVPLPTFVEFKDAVPDAYALMSNYPNPFNPSTQIEFSIPENGRVKLEVYNTLGQLIKVLVNKEYSAGLYEVTWNGNDESGNSVVSGVYIYKMTAGNFAQAKTMVLAK